MEMEVRGKKEVMFLKVIVYSILVWIFSEGGRGRFGGFLGDAGKGVVW